MAESRMMTCIVGQIGDVLCVRSIQLSLQTDPRRQAEERRCGWPSASFEAILWCSRV